MIPGGAAQLLAAAPLLLKENDMNDPITAAEGLARVLTARTLVADAVRDLGVAAHDLTTQPLDHDSTLHVASALEGIGRELTRHLAYDAALPDGEGYELDEQGVTSRLAQTAEAVRTIAGNLDRAVAEVRGLVAGLGEPGEADTEGQG